jgi:cytochrome o ubiquinol oxidase subunit 3
MNSPAATADAAAVPAAVARAGAGGPAPVRIVVAYGFWIFLLSDIILFSALFAAYAVLNGRVAGGPTARELFELRNVGIETVCLLFSSYTCGLGSLFIERRRRGAFFAMSALTFVLGAAFLGLEASEFARMIARGAGPSRSAFLSSFFALVGLHGTHVTVGLLWMLFMTAQVAAKGPREFVLRRLRCFALFWHALDIVWVAVMSLVYLMGVRS